MDTTEIQRIVRNYYEQLYAKKFDNIGEMNTFWETSNVPKPNQEEAQRLNRLITADEIEAVIKKISWHTKSLDWTLSQENFIKHLKKS